ncbi:MAG TPA: histidine kinase [Candidatus Binataceae bacterium]|jgi:signal transduction histidine kinase
MKILSALASRIQTLAITPQTHGFGPNGAFMNPQNFQRLDVNIARGRIVLSLLATLSLYVDPSTAGGLFHLSGHALTVLLCHLAYSVSMYVALLRRPPGERLLMASTALDLFFATAVAFVTEGQTSPAYVYFVFAIIAVGIRPGLLTTIGVTCCSVALYLLVILLSERISDAYVMRAAYLAIAGYLIGFVGQQRADFEERVRELETRAERHSIARSLHDGYVQALAGVNMRLQTCRELIRRRQPEDALAELVALQAGVAREYDQVRAYIRELAGVEEARATEIVVPSSDPRFEVCMSFAGRSTTGEHLLQILLEALRNARRHGMPQSIKINVNGVEDKLLITIDDDGVGFVEPANPPWAIASRVAELGGQLIVNQNGSTRLQIEMPND